MKRLSLGVAWSDIYWGPVIDWIGGRSGDHFNCETIGACVVVPVPLVKGEVMTRRWVESILRVFQDLGSCQSLSGAMDTRWA